MAKPKLDRTTILRNSLSVFKTKGYNGTSMNDLANANGLLKGSMYHYIESKESLMLEVLTALKEHYITKVFSKGYDDSLAPYDRLRELAMRAEEIFIFEEGGDFLVNIGLETKNSVPAFGEVIKEFFQAWIKTMQHLYSNVLDEVESKEKAELIVAEIEGSVLMMKLLDDVNYLHRTNERLLKEYRELEKEKIYK
ncbi:TetR/AcrR family transcriptional regulator [Bacteroidia bacterium]|mgnify:CR=1 FL=1|jgi:TetR/AcrR family transcriptional repressor of nem operon|nr:TetR/AcrR family transcriptional regulator [Bacteroidia bacterium]|tara:strand:+ start:403 stop:987 length:585 start_codon:yes stop_codon:yes gene_type:complete